MRVQHITSSNPPKTEDHSCVSETGNTSASYLVDAITHADREAEANGKPYSLCWAKRFVKSRWRGTNNAALRLHALKESTAHCSAGNAGSGSSLSYGASKRC